MFLLPPKDNEIVIKFRDLSKKEIFNKLFEWELISENQKNKQLEKSFKYFPSKTSNPIQCSIFGYIEYESQYHKRELNQIVIRNTIVVSIDNQLHKIMPQYLKEMQKSDFKNNKNEEEE